jgi:16S rRNA (adenine1518-N6/adenine1519-N6)-dimethyltransferase
MEKDNKVRAKKSLGQHFLRDENIAKKIVDTLTVVPERPGVLEIGPGMGVLTKYLITNPQIDLKVSEIDRDSVAYLKMHFPQLAGAIIEGDFLQLQLETIFPQQFSIIGNFPYNISSQIFFKVLDYRHQVV